MSTTSSSLPQADRIAPPPAFEADTALSPGRLATATGDVFEGRSFGATRVAAGGEPASVEAELVFNTTMCGYQESLTDPSYRGQVLVQTAPLIGNTGTNSEDEESAGVQVSGLVVRELARRASNYRADAHLDAYLRRHGVLGLAGVDTRAITRLVRSSGAMPCVLTDAPRDGVGAVSDAELVARARSAASMAGQNLVPMVGCSSERAWEETLGAWSPRRAAGAGDGPRVLAIDCGAKRNILRHLADRGCRVAVIPHDTPAASIVERFDAGAFDGLFISNGPGDPSAVQALIASLREVLEARASMPVFGICLGHQLLSLAVGATTSKLPFGHRGANQPVLVREVDDDGEPVGRGVVEITSQNHGFVVDRASLEAAGGLATHVHLNDGTLAGFRLRGRPVFSVQYHPEASPGPHDAAGLFDRFVEAMRSSKRAPRAG